MSETNENALLEIEDRLRAELSGDLQRNALDYIAFLKANGMTPDSVICTYPVDNIIGWTIFMGGYDSVLLRSDYQDFPIDEELKEFAWAHVKPCFHFTNNLRESGGNRCGCGREPGRSITIFGKKFDNVCTAALYFRNPEGKTLELVKRLAEVWKRSNAAVAKNDKPYVPGEKEWPCVKGFGSHAGRPLGKTYTKSLDVKFYITPRRRYVNDAAFGFSGGGWIPSTPEQIPVALHIGGHSARFRAIKEPASGWAAVETLKYQANVTYFTEMSINIADSTYSATIWMLDANGEIDTPYLIAKNFPFRLGGNPAVPAIKAIDTVYMGSGGDDFDFIIKDFKVVGGE